MRAQLPAALAPHGVTPDLSHAIALGESAGGWLAVQSALLHSLASPGPAEQHQQLRIRAVISAYGMLHTHVPHLTAPAPAPPAPPKKMFGFPFSQPASKIYEARARGEEAREKGQAVPVAATPPARQELIQSLVGHGLLEEVMGGGAEKYPMQNGEKAGALAPMWLYHGRGDSAVPVEASTGFAEKVGKLGQGDKVKLTLRDGEHGFDVAEGLDDPEAGWVREGVAWVEKRWFS